MKTSQRTLLSVAVALAVGGLASNAMAVTDLTGAGSPPILANETPVAALNNTNGFTVNLQGVRFQPVPTNYAVSGVNYMYGTVKLTGGAKFKNPLSLKLYCATAGAGATATSGLATLQSATGDSVLFAYNTGKTIAAKASGCYVASAAAGGTILTLSGSPSSKSISFSTRRNVGGTNADYAPSSNTQTVVEFQQAAEWRYSAGGANAWIDVKYGSQKLSGQISQTTAYMGYIYFKSAGDAAIYTLSAADGNAWDLSGDRKVLLSGAGRGVNIALKGAPIAGASKVYLTDTATTTCGAANVIRSSAPSSAGDSVTFNGMGTAAAQFGAAGEGIWGVCIQYSGSAAISSGTLEVTLSKTSSTKYNISTTGAGALWELKKNGKSFKLFNMNMPENMGGSATEVSNIRLYNTGSANGNVRATVYGSDGTVQGTGGSIVLDSTAFVKGSAHVVKMADLLTACGVTSYTGAQRPWVLLEGEVPSMSVQVVTRNKATGVVVNMSPVTAAE